MSEEYDPGQGPGAPDPYAERVLDTIELIPPGRVMTYGDVAEWVRQEAADEAAARAAGAHASDGRAEGHGGRHGHGRAGRDQGADGGGGAVVRGGPRQVGRVLALYGGGVPWWRVVRADGVLLPGHELSAIGHYRDEGTPLRQTGPAAEGHVPRVDMRRARWDGHGPGTAPEGASG